MKAISVFAYNVPEIIREVAKKGTESDITLYNRKDGDNVTTFLVPSRFPEKMSSLTDSIFPADLVILGIEEINRDLGEVIIALDLMQKKRGYIALRDDSKMPMVRKLIENTVASNYKFIKGSPVEFMNEIYQSEIERKNGETVVIVDHFFKVKSVGTVALGFVLSGTVSKHQNLFASGLEKQVQVRSIQMQDVDVESAPAGSRVGLGLKNIEVDDMERGLLLTEAKLQPVTSIRGNINFHRSVVSKNVSGNEIFICDQMKYARGFRSGDEITLDRPFVALGTEITICSNTSVPRILGTVKTQ
jgi:selenocysteine-specific translation elongation factor